MTRLIKYNPAFLDAAERAQRFGARHHDLCELLQILRENLGRPRNQHVVVVGARGMGKTTLLLRTIDEACADETLSAGWLPIVAPEETYRAGTIGEFWLEMVFHLSRATDDPAHERAYERLKAEHDRPASDATDTRLAVAALGYLLDFADRHERRLLLVVENLQMLFGEQLTDRDAWAFREVLIGEPRVMLLGSAVSFFHEIEDPQAPLFEQFLIHRLERLDTGGCLDLWQRATGEAVPPRRMRALEILTGGNPRLLTILAEFAGKLSLRELTSDLAGLLDEHTDYLKLTTEALPPLERKVFVTLAEIWDYARAAEVAAQARIDSNVASAQLARLVDRGAVVWRRKGRGKQYRIAERLYGIYHLMRRRGGVAARARAATEFMVAYYDTPALVRQMETIATEALSLAPEERSEHLQVIDAILDSRTLARHRSEIIAHLPSEMATLADAPERLRQRLQSPAMPSLLSDREGKSFDLEDLPASVREALPEVDRALEVGEPKVAIAALERLISLLDAQEAPRSLASSALLGRGLRDLANQESAAGLLEEALASIGRAVETYESLPRIHSEAFLPDLARSLNSLSLRQSTLGLREEALASVGRAVEIYESLAKARPEAFLPGLAMSLNNLSNRQSDLDLREEALTSIGRAVEIRDGLAKALPNALLPDLAVSLNDLSTCQSALGMLEEALASIGRAVEIYEELAKALPRALLPNLAMLLNNLSNCQAEVGLREEALASIGRAVEIYEELAKALPETYLPDLAMSLNNLSSCQSALGLLEEALASIGRAVEIRESLAKAHPETYLPHLAMSLSNLSNHQSALGLRDEALELSGRAVEIYESLANARPEAFLPALATSLNNLSIHQMEVGLRKEALVSIDRAVEIRESLAKARPEVSLPDLATSLNNLSSCQSNLGLREEALISIRRAVEIREGLAKARPEPFLPDLAVSLNNLSIEQSNLGRREEALDSIGRAVEIFENLAKARPEAFLANLAGSLNNLSSYQSAVGKREEALASIGRAVEIRESLAKARPEAFLHDLAGSLQNLSKCQLALGLRVESLASLGRAVNAYRELASKRTLLFRPMLVQALILQSDCLSRLERYPEAELASSEAVDLDPDDPRARAALGLLLARSGQRSRALDQLRAILASSGTDETRTRAVIELAVALAALGEETAVHALIESSPLREGLEPLTVALATLMGQGMSAPAEIEEIAQDIVRQVAERRRETS